MATIETLIAMFPDGWGESRFTIFTQVTPTALVSMNLLWIEEWSLADSCCSLAGLNQERKDARSREQVHIKYNHSQTVIWVHFGWRHISPENEHSVTRPYV